ncbi:MAG: SDR family NAD(P)-dependent oxidoreductase [Lachnospiraceae bacterium]|jgi:short-subunit dehydrogenase
MMNTRRLQIAVVTGASSGMGRETVIQLADRFACLDEIWVLARRKDRLIQLESQVPVRLRIFEADITNEEDLNGFRNALGKESPHIRFLVNAAGYGKTGRSGQIDGKMETGMVDLNCKALLSMTQICLPYLAEGGKILQYASAAAFLPQPGFAVYAASKAFVLSYSRALNRELKSRRITVTAVCPGPVQTEFFQVMEEGGQAGSYPLYKRLVMAKPEKVVKKAIEDSVLGNSISVYGIAMKGFCLMCKILPQEWILSFMEGRKRGE